MGEGPPNENQRSKTETPKRETPTPKPPRMVIYEVNLAVESDRVNEYSAWLEEHVREMLELDGFENAALYARSSPEDTPDEDADAPDRVPEGERHWTVHYHLDSREALDRYLDEDADAMRADADSGGSGGAFFDSATVTERRVLESRKVFSHQER